MQSWPPGRGFARTEQHPPSTTLVPGPGERCGFSLRPSLWLRGWEAVSAWTPKSTYRSLSSSFNVDDKNSIFASSPNISFESKNSFFIISHHNLKLIIDPNFGLNLILAINQKVFSPSYYNPAGQSAKKHANIITRVWYCNPAQHFASCHCHTCRQNKAVWSVPTQIMFCTL